MERQKREYNSKYKGLPAEEIIRIQKERQRRWKEGLSEEKKKEYGERYKDRYKDKNAGRCEVCEKEYKNIYQHKRSKKHKEEEERRKKI
jgi:hypothetical protein